MSAAKPNVVFVLGGPGAGKGTQCTRIVDKFGYVHLSAGDLLRAEKDDPSSQFGELINHHITNGTIVPVEITCSLIERAVSESGKSHFLVDGFPRNQNNLDGWKRQMSDKTSLLFVLFFDCPEEVCVNRCLDRGKTSGRTDDNIESLQKRIRTYNNDTRPIIEHYEKQSLVRRVDANRSAEEVFSDVEAVLKEYQ